MEIPIWHLLNKSTQDKLRALASEGFNPPVDPFNDKRRVNLKVKDIGDAEKEMKKRHK